VVAPLAIRDGGLPRRVDDRYTVCVFPFLADRSYRFGPYTDPLLRGRALEMIAALHRATPASTTWPARYACSAAHIAIHPTPGGGGTAWHPGWNSFPDGSSS